jgi:hypothetical protein
MFGMERASKRNEGDDTMAAATSTGIEAAFTKEPLRLTLLELVGAVCDVTNSDAEVVATVIHMIETGRVRLSGSFRDVPVPFSC